LTFALLAAVAVVGITLLGSNLLAAFKAEGKAEQALVPDTGLLNFEAPTATVMRLRAKTEDVEMSTNKAEGLDSLLVRSWRYTQNPVADAFQVSWTAFFLGFYAFSAEEFIDTLGFLSAQQQLQFDIFFTALYNLARFVQGLANSTLPLPLRSPTLPPPASPFI
jgi:hypothetical protein